MQNLDPKENEKLDQKEEEQHSDSDGSDGDGYDTSTESGIGGNGPVKPPTP